MAMAGSEQHATVVIPSPITEEFTRPGLVLDGIGPYHQRLRPGEWEGKLRYPPPIVDVAQAAKEARAAMWAVRRDPGFRDEANRVVKKHASRKDPQRHFVNDRAPRSKTHDGRQMSLDL